MTLHPLPIAPVGSGVEHSRRTATILNKAGSDPNNALVNGIGVKLSYIMVDANDIARGAVIEGLDDNGAVTDSANITSLFTYNTSTLKATADLGDGAGYYFSSATGKRNIIRIKTNRGRQLINQFFVRDNVKEIVLLNGAASSWVEVGGSPILVPVGSFPVTDPIQVAASLFPFFNDEIARQHGQQNITIGGLVKPYGGAKFVVVQYLDVGTGTYPEIIPESPCEEVTQVPWSPSIADEEIKLRFQFRSESGGASVNAFPWLKATDVTPSTITVTTCPSNSQWDCPPIMDYPPPPPGTPDDAVTLTSGREITVDIEDLGIYANGTPIASVDVTVHAYKNTIAPSGTSTVDYTGPAHIETYTSTGEKTIALPAHMDEADVFVAEISDGQPTPLLGNSLQFVSNEVHNVPLPPQVSNLNYTWGTPNSFMFNLNDLGYPGETVSIKFKAALPGIDDGGSSAQKFGDIFSDWDADVEFQRSTIGTSIILEPVYSQKTTAVAVWFENSFGTTGPFFYENAGADYGKIKTGPTISAGTAHFRLEPGTGIHQVGVIVDDTGDDVATSWSSLEVTLVDDATSTLTVVSTQGALVGVGEAWFDLDAGDTYYDKPGVYHFWLVGEQGRSNVLTLDNP